MAQNFCSVLYRCTSLNYPLPVVLSVTSCCTLLFTNFLTLQSGEAAAYREREGKTAAAVVPLSRQIGISMSAAEDTPTRRAKGKRRKSTPTPRKSTPASACENGKSGKADGDSAKKLNIFHYFGGGGSTAAAAAPRTPVTPKQPSKAAARAGSGGSGSAKRRSSGFAAAEEGGPCNLTITPSVSRDPACWAERGGRRVP